MVKWVIIMAFDHVYAITNDEGKIIEVWIVDSKQMGSTKKIIRWSN